MGDTYLREERFDGLLLNLAQQCQGIEPLLDTMFSFLRRKTDFYSASDRAKEMILKCYEKHLALAIKTENEKKRLRAEEESRATTRREAARKKAVSVAATKAAKEEVSEVVEMDADGSFDAEKISAAEETEDEVKEEISKMEEDPGNEDKKEEPPPPGNGGKTSWGVWSQQLAELQMQVPIPANIKSRDLAIDIGRKHLKVQIKGQDKPLIDADFFQKVVVEECFWTLEEDAAGNKEIVISLQKDNKMEWWKQAIQGDPEIDTTKVTPENSKLSELDGETRMTVEKMMFDQRQKALGRPTADEMGKQDVLEKFMKQHPEMDFSKAKFS
mmetsp:Transcript_14115/g.18855  ORF Transcript_14115/g.18855 Transcript_14115/m.18855 type:complete len:328 (+) Transcript_14115:33-1016(+)|eukprot:CAMPEP_0197305070 /NCGR_PEP_ID=MMETSP0891-20130614/856_1 /TAXON_ID=44058 ORGANISM="Aureoumbra lagunensis, Strain CCMP1510" /NCGR_SAMPLE_ID=MMETSP0891 /ASSEMBLY_ACC=CAM_ASM_000534 /LENGTH=327 /DNA_ID=CAMNT_0042785651 /DNA_START=46 /DNA_END=1029 /DNA_ORIENTATION=-